MDKIVTSSLYGTMKNSSMNPSDVVISMVESMKKAYESCTTEEEAWAVNHEMQMLQATNRSLYLKTINQLKAGKKVNLHEE